MIRRNTTVKTFRRIALKLILIAGAAALPTAARAQKVVGGVDVSKSATTSLASFVTGSGGGAIPIRLPPGRSRVQPMDFLVQYGQLFGLTDPAAQVVAAKTGIDALGYAHTTYAQVHAGVPVFSRVLKVHQDPAGRIIAANGDFYPAAGKVDPTPALGVAQAEEIAISRVGGGAPEVVYSELVIVDPGWYGDPPLGARLAYHLIVMERDRTIPLREAFFVDAHTGSILDRWSMIDTAVGRRIHDADYGTNLPGPRVRFEGDPPTGDYEVDAAYDYTGDTLGYYLRAHGHVGIDGLSGDVVVTVRYGGGICPNAFWNGEQITFCEGLVTDDILGHEYAHGVTEFSAGLIYQNQSGQLNESFSDVFGELVDLFNGDVAFPGDPGGTPWPTDEHYVTSPGFDTPNDLRNGFCLPNSVRWLVGEDATAFGGAIRDMWNPPCHGHPDRANSPLQVCGYGGDSGGVHSGSGVPNHAFAIATDGKTFNGYTVTGIGPIKSGAVWYRALAHYLTPASDFQDAYAAFNQSAADLISTFPNDPRTGAPSDSVFAASDAAQVDLALRAVEMDTPGRCGQTFDVLDSEPPLTCTPQAVIFEDDFEAGANGWTVSNSNPPTPYDWAQVGDLPFGRPGTAWFCADPNYPCGSQHESGVHSLFSPTIDLSGELNFPTLAFTHYALTEPTYDGGNLKVSVDGGPWELVPAEAFVYNGYNTAAFGNAHPLIGEPSFSGGSGEWGTSLVDLTDLVAGAQTLRLRFDFGKDRCTGQLGWFLDEVRLYTCSSSQDCNENGIPDDVEVAEDPHPDVLLSNPPMAIDGQVADADNDGQGMRARAEKLVLNHTATIDSIKIWGFYDPTNQPGTDDFTVIILQDAGGVPGAAIALDSNVASTRIQTGDTLYGGLDEWEITLALSSAVQLEAGVYYVEIYNNTADTSSTFLWETVFCEMPQHYYATYAPGQTWYVAPFNLAIEITAGIIGTDCDNNGVPDECQPDCNTNGIADPCDIATGTSRDCEPNGVPDECEFADCNTNGVHDACDILDDTSEDCEPNGIPDECEFVDCNTNGTHDGCDVASAASPDCNTNGVPDECDVASGTSPDTNVNGVPDECEECLTAIDCDDGLYCNGAEQCVDWICTAGADPCPSQGCDEHADSCVVPPECASDIDCGDGLFCNGTERCVSGQCQPGTDPCPGQGCNETDRECVAPGACSSDLDCDDGVFCNGAETCTAGSCRPGAVPCINPDFPFCDETGDDCDECARDSQCDDLDELTRDACVEGTCVNTQVADSDEDGVKDEDDACPNTGVGQEVNAAGCACEQLDDDGDGVSNCDDLCPNTPHNQQVGPDGCPTKPAPGQPVGPPGDGGDDGDADGAGSDDEAVTGDDDPTETPVSDPLPSQDAEPGADSPADQETAPTASGGGTARSSSARRSAGTCGVLGALNLVFLLTGLALLRTARRR